MEPVEKVGAGRVGGVGHSREAWLCRIRFKQAGPSRWGALAPFPGRRFTCLTCIQVSWKERGLTGAVSRAGPEPIG